MTRTLVLMRHSKSAWPVGVRDAERPLNTRGRANAAAAGRWLNGPGRDQLGGLPQLVRVSTAQRTRQTWALASEAAGIDQASAEFESSIYAASWWDLLDLVRATGADVTTALIIGHNPGMEDLAEELAGSGRPDLLRQLRAKFPTSGIAVLTSEQEWSTWGSGCAALTDFSVPR